MYFIFYNSIPAPVVCKKPQLSEYEMIREKNIAEQRLLFLQHMKSLSSAAVARPPQDKRPRKQRSMDTMGRKRPRKEYRWLYLLCMSLDFNINKILDAGSPGFIILILYLIAPGPKQDNLKKKHHKLLGKSTQMMMKKKWFILQRKEEVIHQDGFLIQMKTSWCLKM